MNPWPLIAVSLAVLCVILYYALIAANDEIKQLRLKINCLWRANIANESHLAAASELWEYCRQVESRNAYLESVHVQFKGILGGSRLMAPSSLDVKERFTIREGSEMP